MAIELKNPYSDLAGVRDPENKFIGRVQLLGRLFSAMMNYQSTSLVGSFHLGKSSILQCLQCPAIQKRHQCDLNHHILVPLDLREYFHKSSDDFFKEVSERIIAQCAGRITIALSSRDSVDEFRSLLTQIKEQDFHLVLLLDAFENITRNKRFEPEFFSFLRAQATMHKASYVTASLTPLYEACHEAIADSPFFNVFATYELGPLTWDEARELTALPAQQAGMAFTQSEIDRILTLSGRHPFFIQRVCYFLFEAKSSAITQEIDQRKVKQQVYHDLRPHFLAIWERLQEAEHERLKDEACRVGSHQRTHLPELSESLLFRRFVRQKCQLHLFNITQESLKDILDNFDNTRALGESDLKHLKLVSLRLKDETVFSSIERGRIIREVLNGAFEQLHGPGVRRDEAPEWQLYNILYYRHFKQRLKHAQIAARLSISLRQYYRVRDKAVEALLDILMEMEVACNQDDDE